MIFFFSSLFPFKYGRNVWHSFNYQLAYVVPCFFVQEWLRQKMPKLIMKHIHISHCKFLNGTYLYKASRVVKERSKSKNRWMSCVHTLLLFVVLLDKGRTIRCEKLIVLFFTFFLVHIFFFTLCVFPYSTFSCFFIRLFPVSLFDFLPFPYSPSPFLTF